MSLVVRNRKRTNDSQIVFWFFTVIGNQLLCLKQTIVWKLLWYQRVYSLKYKRYFHFTEEFHNLIIDIRQPSWIWWVFMSLSGTLHRWNFKTQQSRVSLVLSLRKTQSGKSHDYHDARLRFKNVTVHTKRKVSVFKFLQVEERFRKAPFSWRISV